MRIRIVRNVSAAENVCRSVRDQQSIFHIILDKSLFVRMITIILYLNTKGVLDNEFNPFSCTIPATEQTVRMYAERNMRTA